MKIRKLIFLIIMSFSLLTHAGCGTEGDTDTNGSITLSPLVSTDTGISQFKVDASAVFSQAFPNVPVTFSWRKISPSDPTGSLTGNNGSEREPTDITGAARHTFFVGQTTEDVFFEVTAKTGSLSSVPQGVFIPAL